MRHVWTLVVAALLSASGLRSQTVEIPTGEWQIYDVTDPINDRTGTIARISDGANSLVLGCDLSLRTRPLQVQLRPARLIENLGGLTNVRFRFDGGDVDLYAFDVLAMFPDPIIGTDRSGRVMEILGRISASEALVVRATDHSGQPIDMRFEIAGGGEAVRRVLLGCGRDPLPPLH